MTTKATVTYRADISDLRRRLAEIPDVTKAEAKRMVRELQNQLKAAEKAAKATNAAISKDAAGKFSKGADKATTSGNKLNRSMTGIAQQMPDVISQLSAGADPLQALAQQGLQVVQSAGLMEAGYSALLPALAPVGIAFAGVATAVGLYIAETEIARKETLELGGEVFGLSLDLDDLEDNLDAGEKAMERVRSKAEDTATDVAVLRGEITKLAAAQERAARGVAEDMLPAFTATAQEITTMQKEVERLEGQLERYQRVADDVDIFISDPTEDLERARERLATAQENLQALKKERVETQELVVEKETLEDAEARARTTSRERAREDRKASREAKKAEQEAIKRLQEFEAIRAAAASDTLTDLDRINMAEQEQLDRLRELAVASGRQSDATSAMAEVEARAARDREAVTQSLIEQNDKLSVQLGLVEDLAEARGLNLDAANQSQELALLTTLEQIAATHGLGEAESDLHDQRVAMAKELQRVQTRAVADMLGTASELALMAAEKQAQGNAKVAEQWFGWYQGLAITQATINGLLASTKAIADYGLPWGLAVAAASAGQVGVQVAGIKAQSLPTFHAGGITYEAPVMAPDEGLAVVRPQVEALLTTRGIDAAGGPEAVARLNRGEAGGQQQLVIEQVYKHRVFGRVVRDSFRIPGSPTRRVIKQGSRVGHRRRR